MYDRLEDNSISFNYILNILLMNTTRKSNNFLFSKYIAVYELVYGRFEFYRNQETNVPTLCVSETSDIKVPFVVPEANQSVNAPHIGAKHKFSGITPYHSIDLK